MTPDLLTKKWAGTQNTSCVPHDSEDRMQRDKVERASIKCILGILFLKFMKKAIKISLSHKSLFWGPDHFHHSKTKTRAVIKV